MEYCILYRHFDIDNKLLYVGITNNIKNRISSHKVASKWFLDIANITLEHFPSRNKLIEAEREAIQNEKPEHNVINKVTYLVKRKKEQEYREKLETENFIRQQQSKDYILNKIVNFEPMYSIASAANVLDIPDVRLKKLIKTNKISYVILGYRGEYPKYGITGWALLDFIEHLQSSKDTIRELYN